MGKADPDTGSAARRFYGAGEADFLKNEGDINIFASLIIEPIGGRLADRTHLTFCQMLIHGYDAAGKVAAGKRDIEQSERRLKLAVFAGRSMQRDKDDVGGAADVQDVRPEIADAVRAAA